MNCYDLFMKPIEKTILLKIRKKLIPQATGDVLEIGIGTGVNIPFYCMKKVTSLFGIDIKLSKEVINHANQITLYQSSSEALPFTDSSFDTIVETLVFCSVTDVVQSLTEIKRVLKPNGIFIWLEHVRPENTKAAFIFDRINGIWKKCSQGCNINRQTGLFIEQTGFSFLSSGNTCKGIFKYGICKNNKC